MKTVNAPIKPDNTAAITCPTCNKMINMRASSLQQGGRRSFRAKCSCKSVFRVQLDSRKYYRKSVNLQGNYMIIMGGQGGGTMSIDNISMGGVGFTVSGAHQLKTGQSLKLDFELNDKHRTTISKKVKVKSVNENAIGCEYARGETVNKALGFFLRF